jgi:hypothetical protein
VTRRIWQERVLVEPDEGSLQPSRIARPQRAVDPLEEPAGHIVISIIDEGVIYHIAEKVSCLGVLCREIANLATASQSETVKDKVPSGTGRRRGPHLEHCGPFSLAYAL